MSRKMWITILMVMMMFLIAVPAFAWEGDTFTPGYWKNHAEAWTDQDIQPDDEFFTGGPYDGMTYIEALGAPARGDAYIILARAYIAALLNEEVCGANARGYLDDAAEMLAEYPEEMDAACRAFAIYTAEMLDYFNNGGEL